MDDAVLTGMSQDDPSVTPPEKYSYDMGVAFPKNAEDQGIVGELLKSRQRSNRSLLRLRWSKSDTAEAHVILT